MIDHMYNISSVFIALILFVSMIGTIEIGRTLGRRAQYSSDDTFKGYVNTVSGSLLGILALLLGFTFSLSLQRFDSRSEAVISESNAIGTTYLRSQLLPVSVLSDVQRTLRQYLDLRIKASMINLAHEHERDELLAEAEKIQTTLWGYARQAVQEDPNPVTTGLFVQSLNELIDSFDRRNAELMRHVPEPVLILLYITFLMVGVALGYGAGIAGHWTPFITYILVTLIVVLVFIVVDLDRPRRGLIEVSQQSLIDLRTSLDDLGLSNE